MIAVGFAQLSFPNGAHGMLLLINAVLSRVCRLFGHCDETHDTGEVCVHYCVFCRDVRVHNYSKKLLDVWFWCDSDPDGTPRAAPYRVVTREVQPPDSSSLT